MHDPGWKHIDRRRFLLGGAVVAGGWTLGGRGLLAREPATGSGPTLLLLRLAGGNDGLSTVVPHGDDAYHRARTSTRIRAREVRRLDDYRGLHPALREMHRMYEEGELAIVEGVGPRSAPSTHFAANAAWNAATQALGHEGARLVVRALPGFDTHNDQRRRHDALLRSLDATIAGLRGGLDTTTVLVYSEFGRAVAENKLGGTDHGAAGPVFAFGAGVRGGLYGAHPSLTELDAGRLVPTSDLRVVLAWFTPPAASCAGA